MSKKLPKVAILMPTFNGARFLENQINSINSQSNVLPTTFIYDDKSYDNSLQIAQNYSLVNVKYISSLPNISNQKSAAISFYRIINGINIPSDFEYIALADQDDIWFSDKLSRAINCLKYNKCGGYSSSVIAYWEDGFNKYLKKSGNTSIKNSLFESAGPGCTYVLTREVFDLFQEFLKKNINVIKKLDFHDWSIYGFVTNNGFKWHIDPNPSMYYRQHSNNSFGASFSIEQKVKRVKMILDGWYSFQVYIMHYLYLPEPLKLYKSNFKIFFRIYLFFSVLRYRRRFFDKISLAFLTLFSKLPSNEK